MPDGYVYMAAHVLHRILMRDIFYLWKLHPGRGAAKVSIFGIVKRFLRKPLHLNVLPALNSRYSGALNFSHKEMMIHMTPREQIKQM